MKITLRLAIIFCIIVLLSIITLSVKDVKNQKEVSNFDYEEVIHILKAHPETKAKIISITLDGIITEQEYSELEKIIKSEKNKEELKSELQKLLR